MNRTLENMLREIEELPQGTQERIARVLEDEVRKARREGAPPAGRWSRLVERMRREAPMAGKSEEFLRTVRDFRDHFDMNVKRAGD
jgi:hypothetical protein